jgi:pimeloyl-ACP methyl ester carboxylesterase
MKRRDKNTVQATTARTGERKPGAARGATPPIGMLYDVDGRRLLLHRSGSGAPAVVFLPGAGMPGLDFLNIHDQVAPYATSVLYDRAGTGWSDQVTLPRSAAVVADELRSLLRGADVPAPYLLVGHSLGGAYARRYAQRFPEEVAGLLLLEPTHEDFFAAMPKQTTRETLQGILATVRLLLHFKAFYRHLFRRVFASWPDAVREPLITHHLATLRKTLQEWPASDRTGTGALSEELRSGGATPDVPVIVLCATGIDPSMAAVMSTSYLRKMTDGKRVFFRALAASFPHGEYRELENAGHTYMHIDRPDAVMRALRDLIESIRVGTASPTGGHDA